MFCGKIWLAIDQLSIYMVNVLLAALDKALQRENPYSFMLTNVIYICTLCNRPLPAQHSITACKTLHIVNDHLCSIPEQDIYFPVSNDPCTSSATHMPYMMS